MTVDHLAPAVPVVRAMVGGTVLRAMMPEDDMPMDMGTLEIRFSRFDTWYEVDSYWEGRFLERTVRGAFADTIAQDQATMRVLFDHGFDPQIGNKVLGAIESLSEEPDSPVGIVPLFDTTYNRDLTPGLEAGVYGSSMRMEVTGQSWDEEPGKSAHNPMGLPERTITKVRVREFGPVTFPANPDATASMRSLTDSYYDRLSQRDACLFEAAVRSTGRPDFTGRPDTRSVGGGGSHTRQRIDTDSLRLRGIIPP